MAKSLKNEGFDNKLKSPWTILVIFLIIVAIVGFIVFFIFRTVDDEQSLESSVLIKVSMSHNSSHSETIQVKNIEPYALSYVVKKQGLGNIASLSETEFILDPGATKEIELSFSEAGELGKNIYTGKILLDSNIEVNEIPLILELNSKIAGVEGTIDLVSGSQITPGEKAIFVMQLYDFSRSEDKTVSLKYGIYDFENNEIVSKEEQIFLSDRASITRFLDLDTSLSKGDYVAYLTIENEEEFFTNSIIVSVSEEEFFSFFGENQVYFLGLLVVFFIFFLIFVLYNENSQEEIVRKLGEQYHAELNSQVESLKLRQKQSESLLKTKEEKERNRKYFEDLIAKAKIQAESVRRSRVREIREVAVSSGGDKERIMKEKLAKWEEEGYKLPSSLRGRISDSKTKR